MKRLVYFSQVLNEPKKTAAIAVFILGCFLFLWEIISAFKTVEQNHIGLGVKPIGSNQFVLTAKSPLFTSALFGTYIPANLSEADIKQSMLDLRVLGILFADKEEDSQVIISSAGGVEKYYLIGDSLPGGAVIKHITAESVVVLHNGTLESLSLPKNELIFNPPAQPLTGE